MRLTAGLPQPLWISIKLTSTIRNDHVNRRRGTRLSCIVALTTLLCACVAESDRGGGSAPMTQSSPIGTGWSQTSVNAVVFRRDSISNDGRRQFVAYYDDAGRLTLARRDLGSDDWQHRSTRFRGRVRDAHNSISIMSDGAGFLHVSWDHHVDPMNYVVSREPGELDLGMPRSMTGRNEDEVTYPEFHRLPSGNLLFTYRDGRAGNGALVLNRYDVATKRWHRLHDALIDGEGERSAYWQLHVAADGVLHLSWVWRESTDAATNHDLLYARSDDEGRTWRRSDGSVHVMPIVHSTAEVAMPVPQGSNLVNQTSMTSDPDGNPYIATYFRRAGSAVTEVQLVYRAPGDAGWRQESISRRKEDFELSGRGSRSLPISRPLIVSRRVADGIELHVIYRDAEYDDMAVLASSFRRTDDTRPGSWTITPISSGPLDRWEPTMDSVLWRERGQLHLYQQAVGQLDAEGVDNSRGPSAVSILEVALPALR